MSSPPTLNQMFELWNSQSAIMHPNPTPANGHDRMVQVVKLDEKIKQVQPKPESETKSHE